MNATTALLSEIIDYAGLFPPSALPMPEVVSNFADYRNDPASWMLARVVVPVARLEEFASLAAEIVQPDDGPWRVSALIGNDLNADIDAIFDFNRQHAGNNEDGSDASIVADAIELRASSSADIDRAISTIPEQITPFFELPVNEDPRGLVAAIAGTEACAKIRCGGITPDLIPSAENIARFICACVSGGVPFKATAGLHHPLRAEQNLTYESNPPRAVMHGFLNVFTATAVAALEGRGGKDAYASVLSVLNETDPGAFVFDDDALLCRGKQIPAESLQKTRSRSIISFGSCSFREPVDELTAMGVCLT